MATVIYPSPIFGPVHSRRLGVSLGINLLPSDGKFCTFDCIYCECGLNFRADSHQPSRDEVQRAVEQKMIELTEKGEGIDVITFAGNGEPTTHRDFPAIIDDIVALRDRYFPEAKISVLSNATMIWKDEVRAALAKVDNNIQKLDSAKDETVKIINQPQGRYSVAKVIDDMRRFEGEVIVQTLFLRGEVNGVRVDNTTEEEVAAWIEALKVIRPKEVMLYSLDRKTPYDTLYKVEGDELQVIADKVEALGIKTQVTK